MRTTLSPGRVRAACLLSAVLMVTAAACGGSGGGSSATDTSATATTVAGGAAGLEAYQACLKQNGIDIPSGGRGATGAATQGDGTRAPRTTDSAGDTTPRTTIDPALREKAQQDCGSLLPRGAAGGAGGPGGFGANVATYTAYLSCLKDNGVAVPDRTAANKNGGAPTGSAPSGSGPTGSTPGGARGAGRRGGVGGVDADGVPTFLLNGVDQAAATFVAANTKCKVLLPEATAPASTTTTAKS
jgi:hypothetical protein